MLEAGISSTRRIAQFWQLLDTAAARPRRAPRQPAHAGSAAKAARGSVIPAASLKPVASAASGVGKIIEDALRAAGLMR